MLDLGDLLTLIRLTELEIESLQRDIDGDDEDAKNDAGEVIIQVDQLSRKLRHMYEQSRQSDSSYPTYEEFVRQLNRDK